MSEKRPQDITSAERLLRVNAVEQLIVQGSSRQDIIQYCLEAFKVGVVASDFYIADAKDSIKQNLAIMFDKEYFKANVFKRLEDLYKQNYDVDDFKECRGVLKDLRDMFGLNEPTLIDSTTTVRVVTPLSFFTTNDKDK